MGDVIDLYVYQGLVKKHGTDEAPIACGKWELWDRTMIPSVIGSFPSVGAVGVR